MYEQSLQETARQLYISGGKTQGQIATQLGIHHKTLSYWIKQNNWADVKTSHNWASFIATQNLWQQLLDFQDSLASRPEGERCPTKEDVNIQSQLIAAIFRFPELTKEEMMNIFKNADSKNPPLDKNQSKSAAAQAIKENASDKKGIKNIASEDTPQTKIETPPAQPAQPEKDKTETNNNPPKRTNIVLRSGARWLEKGRVYDPIRKQNRSLTRKEYEELIAKGLTKMDFEGWSL